MGIFMFALDTVVTSTAFAGVKRITGIDTHTKVNSYITSTPFRTASDGFFGIGEFVWQKGEDYWKKEIETQKKPTVNETQRKQLEDAQKKMGEEMKKKNKVDDDEHIH